MRHIVVLFIFLFSFEVSPVEKQKLKTILPPFSIDNPKEKEKFIQHVAFFRDDTGRLTFNEISREIYQDKFILNKSIYPIFGYTKGSVWGKVIIYNAAKPVTRYLIFEVPYVDSAEIFFKEKSQWISKKIDDEDPFSQRQIKNRKMIFQLDIETGVQEVYFRIWGSSSIEPLLSFVSLEDLVSKNNFETLGNGIYIGILMVMFFYNLFLFISLRDKVYLYYILFVFFYLYSQLGLDGYLREIFFPNNNELMKFSRVLAGPAAIAFSILFAIHFLQLKNDFPLVYKIYKISLYFLVIPVALYFLAGFSIAIQAVLLTIFLLTCIHIVMGFYAIKKSTLAKYYAMAWSLFFIGAIAYAIKIWNISIPYLSPYAMKLGSSIEATILSFGLGYRIRLLREENKKLTLVSKEVEFASKFQKELLPKNPPQLEGINIAYQYHPGEFVGGDFLDFAVDPYGRIIVLICDVSGHGYRAGLIASMVKVIFKITAGESGNGIIQMQTMNSMLKQNINNNFVTASNLRLDTMNKSAELVCAGHLPMIIFNRKTKEIRECNPAGGPLGIADKCNFDSEVISLESGHRYFLYTDGFIDETNSSGEEFGLERLFEAIKKGSDFDAASFAEYLKVNLENWNDKGHQVDDIAFLVIDCD